MNNKPVVYSIKPAPKPLAKSAAWPARGTVSKFLRALALGKPSAWTLKGCVQCGPLADWSVFRSNRYENGTAEVYYLFCEHLTARAYLEFEDSILSYG